MGKTLFVSDLDGTLLSPETIITEESKRLLNEAIDHGALFTIATARTPATVSRLLKGIRMPLPAIVMTGSALWNVDNGIYEDVKFLEGEVAKRLHAIYLEKGLPTFIYTLKDNKLQIYHSGSLSDLDRKFIAERVDSPYKEFHITESGNSEIPDEAYSRVLLFYTMYPDDMVEAVYCELRKDTGCYPVSYHDMYGGEVCILEVFSSRTSKAAAVKRMAERTGADRITVFGDNINDLSMMQVADTPVAVENAIEEVKAKARIVIGPNSMDSVARYILDSTLNRDILVGE